MKPAISIFNHVIGPVMRGPSSSHTAGAYHIASIGRSLLGDDVREAVFSFDSSGSYARTYSEQGADLAFAVGLMGWDLTDDRFAEALVAASDLGLQITFEVRDLENPNHPNAVDVLLRSVNGREIRLRANSIGGGAVEITRFNGWRVDIRGGFYELLVESSAKSGGMVRELLPDPESQTDGDSSFIVSRFDRPIPPALIDRIRSISGVRGVWTADPVFFVHRGDPIFTSAREAVALADERGTSLGGLALEYESALLGISESKVIEEMLRRYDIMRESVRRGLNGENLRMQLLDPSAGEIFDAEGKGRSAVGGIHLRAAARAMAVMHVNSSMGVVCAAPTGGAAGTLPGAIVTLAEERAMNGEEIAKALLAAGAIGVIVANRATFAAEVAGCQVEIGAAGAMAAAAVVECAGGSASQAADAAAISFQNTMGSVCDLVQGIVEIPCHTRNAVAAANAFICADLIMSGYRNPIDLDETIDAVDAVGRMLPPELRCTALGGLAITPSAISMTRKTGEVTCAAQNHISRGS